MLNLFKMENRAYHQSNFNCQSSQQEETEKIEDDMESMESAESTVSKSFYDNSERE